MDFNKLKNEVKKNKGMEIVFASSDDELNRKVMEKLNVSGVLIFLDERKDYTKQRDSGFNEVMAKIARKNNMSVYFDFDELFNSKNRERVLSRLRQNIELCNRVGVQVKVVLGENKKSLIDIRALFSTLGAPTWMLKDLF